MTTYIPNATQLAEPVESRTVESAALEFRTLKTSINERLDAETDARVAGDDNLQTQASVQAERIKAIEAALLAFGDGAGMPGTVYVQRLSGTGAQTAFTLNVSVPASALIDVFINGVYQNKDTFTIVGDVLTFSEAPPAGTNNVEVVISITLANVETDASLVSFRATDSTAVVRTVQDKMREVVSVKDFGAVGDGITDDTVAIQNAVNAALNVFFPLGTYYVTAPINVRSFSKLSGESYQNRTSQIRLADGINFVGVANAQVRPDFDELLNVNLHGLGFYGTGSSVVNIADASRIYLVEWVVENCWFGWSLENCFRSRFVTSEFLNNRFGQNDSLSRHANHSHLVMKGVATPVFTETNVIGVRNNRFDSAPATGNTIYAELGYMMRVDNNTIQGNACPLRIFGVVGVSLTDNYFEKNTAGAIIVAGEDTQSQNRYTDITLENNYIYQEAPISTVVSVVSRPDRTFARFQTNYIRFTDGGSFYLTTSSLGNDRNIMSSEGNFVRVGYAGALATNYVNGAMHTTTHLEDAVTEVMPNMGHRVVSGSLNSAHSLWSSRPDINGLLGGSDFGAIIDSPENAHLVLGLRTDEINDSFAILSNHGGAAKGDYDTLVARFRRDGVTTLPGVYGSTSAESANVVVSATGVLQRATSSARWKELIRPLELDTAFIYTLEPRTFDYKDGGPKGVSGFIAESVFAAEPSAASVDAEGLPDGINWNVIIVALVAEIKRLKARIDSMA